MNERLQISILYCDIDEALDENGPLGIEFAVTLKQGVMGLRLLTIQYQGELKGAADGIWGPIVGANTTIHSPVAPLDRLIYNLVDMKAI